MYYCIWIIWRNY